MQRLDCQNVFIVRASSAEHAIILMTKAGGVLTISGERC